MHAMGRMKKMNLLPSLFSSSSKYSNSNWPSSCKHPKTMSFRAQHEDADDSKGMFKTVNSIFFEFNEYLPPEAEDGPSSRFLTTCTSTSASERQSTDHEGTLTILEDMLPDESESVELLVRGVRSDRLFFEPQGDTSSILGIPVSDDDALNVSPHQREWPPVKFKESVVLAMESGNPYLDFRRSMEEMVESHGIKDDWDCLEELFGCYLRMNGRENHGFIVEAFIDLLLNISSGIVGSNTNTKTKGNQSCGVDGTRDYSCRNTDVTSFSSAASSFSDDSSSSGPCPCLRGDDIVITEEEKSTTTMTAAL